MFAVITTATMQAGALRPALTTQSKHGVMWKVGMTDSDRGTGERHQIATS
jgi:hypothetical protein